MEGKVKKLLVATGALMSAAIALVPLTTYARVTSGPYGCGTDTDASGTVKPCATGEGTTQINVNVAPTLAFDPNYGETEDEDGNKNGATGDTVVIFPNMINESGKITASIRSAKIYTISLSAEQTALMNVDDESFSIPAKAELSAGTSAWGIKKVNSDGTPASSYTAIRQSSEVFFTGGPHDDFTTTEFPFGVSVSSKLPQGTYATDVIITAAVKE